ncbi:MAG: NADP-dependent malic enzyme [Gammaproteobacteria bacterium]|jgi:malate dehydrogenase (oxaloacetate-decarboxylating)(NADP+)|nr:NADP-dependent malic enzyme [Gammaproteobacteria bacterium]
MSDEKREKALNYHSKPTPGKLRIEATKPMTSHHDLTLAYSPGVAYPCLEIQKNPLAAAEYTSRANLVGVITNGSAVLGLGNIGALAAKPVMEGKAVLFKRFAGIDVFDIEIDEADPHKLAETIERLEPTFCGINLEDIKAPDCFYVEKYLHERMSIPVFHDDQHGTAIVVAAAMKSALEVVGKDIGKVKLVASGAGAAALSCLKLLVTMGLDKNNILVCDSRGVIYSGRTESMDEYKSSFAVDTGLRTLSEAMVGADVFLGLSAGNLVTAEMVDSMSEKPIVFALANPTPEIDPAEAKRVRPDVVMATGRTDYPNQVNNVLCFPFLFRGALDAGATEINQAMKVACVDAISRLARAGTSDVVASAYHGESLTFGPEYLIPKPFDQRLILEIAPAVAQAAMDSGVAVRPIDDMKAYRQKLSAFVFRSGLFMKPVFDLARASNIRVAFAEGETPKVLQAIESILQEQLCAPIAIGREEVMRANIKEYGLTIVPGRDFEVMEYQDNEDWVKTFHESTERRGTSLLEAREILRNSKTTQAAMMVKMGLADTMICGTIGRFHRHLSRILSVAQQDDGFDEISALSIIITGKHTLFIADTHITTDPTAEAIAEMTVLAATEVARFGLKPKAALLSHSSFGSRDSGSSRKMRKVLSLLRESHPELMVEGEMQAELALSPAAMAKQFPNSKLTGVANLLVMPNLDAAHIAMNLIKSGADGVPIGPILLGCDIAANIVTPGTTVRGLVNMTAIAAARSATGSH